MASYNTSRVRLCTLGLFNPKNPVWYAPVIKKFFRRLHSVEMMVSALASIASLRA